MERIAPPLSHEPASANRKDLSFETGAMVRRGETSHDERCVKLHFQHQKNRIGATLSIEYVVHCDPDIFKYPTHFPSHQREGNARHIGEQIAKLRRASPNVESNRVRISNH
jgi:hypothetical protein